MPGGEALAFEGSTSGDGDDISGACGVLEETIALVLRGFFGIADKYLRQLLATELARKVIVVERNQK